MSWKRKRVESIGRETPEPRSRQIIIHYRGPESKVRMVEELFRSFQSRYVYLTYEEHDEVTANTQAVTHAAFLRYARAV